MNRNLKDLPLSEKIEQSDYTIEDVLKRMSDAKRAKADSRFSGSESFMVELSLCLASEVQELKKQVAELTRHLGSY